MSGRIVCPSGRSLASCIRIARESVGSLYRFGGGWAFNHREPVAGAAWRQSSGRPYWQAVRARSSVLCDYASMMAGLDPPYFASYHLERDGGSWVASVGAAAAVAP